MNDRRYASRPFDSGKWNDAMISGNQGSAVLQSVILDGIENVGSAPLWAAGPSEFVKQPKIGFFCSSQCPGSIVLKTLDTVTKMRDDGQAIIGGFHSVMEWDCLQILLRGRQPIIWVPARSITGMRLKPELQPAFEQGRLLILSPFPPSQNRITTALAQQRNRFVGALADTIFIPHAAPGSRTLALGCELHRSGKQIMTIADPQNIALIALSPKYYGEASPNFASGGAA